MGHRGRSTVPLIYANPNVTRCEPNLGDLMPALKLRLSDKNQSVMIHAITLVGDLAQAVGPPIKNEATSHQDPVGFVTGQCGRPPLYSVPPS